MARLGGCALTSLRYKGGTIRVFWVGGFLDCFEVCSAAPVVRLPGDAAGAYWRETWITSGREIGSGSGRAQRAPQGIGGLRGSGELPLTCGRPARW
jgi:hypothetical protein